MIFGIPPSPLTPVESPPVVVPMRSRTTSQVESSRPPSPVGSPSEPSRAKMSAAQAADQQDVAAGIKRPREGEGVLEELKRPRAEADGVEMAEEFPVLTLAAEYKEARKSISPEEEMTLAGVGEVSTILLSSEETPSPLVQRTPGGPETLAEQRAYIVNRSEVHLRNLGPRDREKFEASDLKEWLSLTAEKGALRILSRQEAMQVRREHPDRIVGSRWVRSWKEEDGEARRGKSRLVILGHEDPDLEAL